MDDSTAKHDPLCPTQHRINRYYGKCRRCDLIARVRKDERGKFTTAVIQMLTLGTITPAALGKNGWDRLLSNLYEMRDNGV